MSAKKQKQPRKVVVCTCRTENYGWIGERRLYNLPLPKGGTGESYATVTHIAVYALDLPVIARAAKYVRDVDGKWLAANAHKYGFIIRYPYNKQSVTGYIYELWHVRWLGTVLASAVYDSGLCLEEYFGITSRYS